MASSLAPPLLTTSSTSRARSPTRYSPSTIRLVPYSFASLRAYTIGRSAISDIATASGKPAYGMPAMRS